MKRVYPKRGFTLIELLVVIAAIAILLAILVPNMRRSLVSAMHTGCVSNMRMLASACSQYAFDNEGALPAPGWGGGRHPTWLYTNYQMYKPDDVKSGLLWPYMDSLKLYRCPQDSPADKQLLAKIANIQPNNCYRVSSYCMNGSSIAFGRTRSHNGITVYRANVDPNTGLRNTVNISLFNGDDIMFWEADDTRITRGMWWDASNTPGEGMTGRHLTWGSVGRIDGGAEKMPRDVYYTKEAPGNRGRTRLWNVPAELGSGNGH